MDRFTTVRGPAVPMLDDDIDTDVIFPARFLLVMEKRGLGRYLFVDRRQGPDGAPRGDFVLDRPQFRGAPILIAGANFGCGSSREQAAWTLADAGFRVIMARSFGEIFHANAFKNGLLPIELPAATLATLADLAMRGEMFEVDLEAQTIRVGDVLRLDFAIDARRRAALLAGHDEIDEMLGEDGAAIARFETEHRGRQPWLFADGLTSGDHP
jgi:3-isopropylmalate/(R)-2-methylmalate dehydratase small subunit